MAEFVTVGSVTEVPEGEAHAFEVNGKAVAVVRVGEEWYAFDDQCTHRACSLAEGELDEAVIMCPCHGSEFDVTTGDVMNGPADDPVATYEVRVEGDSIQVSV
jgi:3-phenylpropionate/trans-cinnamate dioxygenase ferredoxin component